MLQHIENPGIVRTIYSGIFRHIQGYSTIFTIQPFPGILRDIRAYSGIIEAYGAITRHISNSV